MILNVMAVLLVSFGAAYCGLSLRDSVVDIIACYCIRARQNKAYRHADHGHHIGSLFRHYQRLN